MLPFFSQQNDTYSSFSPASVSSLQPHNILKRKKSFWKLIDLEHYVCWEQKFKDNTSAEGEESSSVHLPLQEVVRERNNYKC
jgi:hypothetical protein